MDVEKMNESIDEMGEIVSKMKTIRDTYAVLEENIEKQNEMSSKQERLLKSFEGLKEDSEIFKDEIRRKISNLNGYYESFRDDAMSTTSKIYSNMKTFEEDIVGNINQMYSKIDELMESVKEYSSKNEINNKLFKDKITELNTKDEELKNLINKNEQILLKEKKANSILLTIITILFIVLIIVNSFTIYKLIL